MAQNKPVLNLGDISGPEGNAFVILGRVSNVYKELKMENWNTGISLDDLMAEAKSGDYDKLLDTVEKYFTVIATGGRYDD